MEINWKKNSPVHLHIVMLKAAGTINSKTGKNFREKGLTSSQFSVLDVLYTKGEMKISELIRKILSTSGNMTVVVKNMETKGWIYRKASPIDRRSFLIGITDEGRKVFEELLPRHIAEIEDTYSNFTLEERKELIRLLKKFKPIK